MRIQEQQQHDVLPEHAVVFIPCDCISTLRADKSDEGGGEELVRKKQQQDGQQQDGQQQQLTHATPSSCSSKSTIAHASTTTSTTATTCARERWQQLRKTMRQLTRGMRKYPIMAKATASSSQQEEDDDPQAVAAGASMLHKDFWLEALDKQHRYGFHLRAFHRAWKDAMMAAGVLAATTTATAADISKNSKQNASFFYWLDHGDGKALELPECTRDALQSMCVQYCDEEARKLYQVKFAPSSSASHQQRLGDGEDSDSSENAAVLAEYAATHELVHTDELSKWIFVIDLQGNMYVGRKRKGVFHHSSFVAGAPIFAAGKIMIKHGKIIAIEPHSGHFKPTLRNLTALCHILRDQHVDLDEIAFIKPKKWSCAWPFPDLPPHLEGCELEDLASDTDYYSYKSDSEEQE